MFRIVTDFIDQPMLLVLCDDRHCANFATKPLPAEASEQDRSAAIEPFVAEISERGWVLAIDQHLCPHHVKRLLDKRRLIELPGFRAH